MSSHTGTLRSVRHITTGNHLLLNLPPELLALLSEKLQLVKLKRKRFICHEGDDPQVVYFPESCIISENKTLDDGRTLEIAMIGREGAAGLLEMYSSVHCSPSYRQVVEAGLAQMITRADLETLFRHDVRLQMALGRYMPRYLKDLSQQSACCAFHSIRQRLCLRFLMIYERTMSLRINATHDELARALGVFRPTVTILSQELRNDGLIENSRGSFQIEDLPRVRREACECLGLLSSTVLA